MSQTLAPGTPTNMRLSGITAFSVNGSAISSADGLTKITAGSHPGDQFAINYVDAYGAHHSATVTVTGWAK